MPTSLRFQPRSDSKLDINDFRAEKISFDIPLGSNLSEVDLSQL